MRIIVGVKRVIDYAVKVRVLPDKSGVDLKNVKMSLNPFCEIALEEAVRLKEQKIVTEIIAVTIGPKAGTEVLRTALAMGCDKGIHITTDERTDQNIQPLAVAKAFKMLAEREKAEMIIIGKQSIDGDNCQTGQMLAGLLGWSQCTFAAKLEINEDRKTAMVERETDSGTETISITLPTVLTADLRLNEPRYPTLPNIMKAKKKPIETLTADEIGVDFTPQNIVIKVEDPPVRKAGSMVDSVDTLIDKLKNEAACI
jgi:electron transfer flavoprotein beta subunit